MQEDKQIKILNGEIDLDAPIDSIEHVKTGQRGNTSGGKSDEVNVSSLPEINNRHYESLKTHNQVEATFHGSHGEGVENY